MLIQVQKLNDIMLVDCLQISIIMLGDVCMQYAVHYLLSDLVTGLAVYTQIYKKQTYQCKTKVIRKISLHKCIHLQILKMGIPNSLSEENNLCVQEEKILITNSYGCHVLYLRAHCQCVCLYL